MTFGHSWVLLLAAVPLLWIVYSWPRTTRHLGLMLKGLSLSAILLAVSEPALIVPQTKSATLVLLDVSNSITADDFARAASMAEQIKQQQGRNWMRVVPFARHTRTPYPREGKAAVPLTRISHEAGDGTDIEAALTESMAALPAGYIPRIVLISDGNENQGSTVRAIAQLERLRVPVDAIPLSGRSSKSIRLLSLSIPHQAYAGEQIPIDLTIEVPSPVHATVEVSAEGKHLGRASAELKAGKNVVRVHARVESTGVTAISGTVRAEGLVEAHFERAVNLQRANLLYLSQDPLGSGSNLLQAFKEAGFEVKTDWSSIDTGLDGIQLVVLNNLDLDTVTAAQKAKLAEYVNGGGGLLVIGGERQVFKQDKQMDALDRALPAKLVPPQMPEGICVALIIDKSSSMEGRKIELARLSASGVVDHLRFSDSIGVLIFDNSFQWAVPLRRVSDKAQIKRLISGITPDGGTQIAPALAEAYRRVLLSNASSKHVVLLTDGISEEGDSIELAKEALSHQVTISTVGLGQDVNRSYLEKVAGASGGKSYFLNEPQGLEQILLKDVQDYSGKTAVEKELRPLIRENAEVLEGVNMESAPALQGYARYAAKPDSETILAINEEKKDPLYVRWQYGLGRAGVFTSDAKSRWASSWMTWAGFDKFWINVTRDLMAHRDPSEAVAEFDTANDDLVVTYRLRAGTPEPKKGPEMYVLGPQGFERPIEVERVADRLYRGRLHTGRVDGLFRVRPAKESAAFPEVGVFAMHGEASDYGINEMLLRELASTTGGRFDPPLSTVFDAAGRSIYVTWQLWPGLLGMAILLTLSELIVRKWSGISQGVRRMIWQDRKHA